MATLNFSDTTTNRALRAVQAANQGQAFLQAVTLANSFVKEDTLNGITASNWRFTGTTTNSQIRDAYERAHDALNPAVSLSDKTQAELLNMLNAVRDVINAEY